MEIKVQKSELARAVGITTNVVNTKATLPILSNLLIQTEGEQILITGTDLEIGIRTGCPAEVIEKGSTAIPARKLHDIIRELPEGDIAITVNKNNAVNIKAGKAYFKIVGLDASDFPKFPEPAGEQSFEIEQNVLAACLKHTSFAVSHDETRYTLNGILISVKGNHVKFVATDGKRLSYIEKEITVPKGVNIESIIPAKTVQELNRSIDESGTVTVTYSKNQIMFQVNNTTIVSRLIEGKFPNYEQVIPKEEKTKAQINREEFLGAIRRVSLLTSQESQSIKLDFLKEKVLVSSRTPNLGEAKEEVGAAVNGEDLTIGFNPSYLIDVLKTLETDQIEFSMSHPDKPGLVRNDASYLYVVMPMQLT